MHKAGVLRGKGHIRRLGHGQGIELGTQAHARARAAGLEHADDARAADARMYGQAELAQHACHIGGRPVFVEITFGDAVQRLAPFGHGTLPISHCTPPVTSAPGPPTCPLILGRHSEQSHLRC